MIVIPPSLRVVLEPLGRAFDFVLIVLYRGDGNGEEIILRRGVDVQFLRFQQDALNIFIVRVVIGLIYRRGGVVQNAGVQHFEWQS